jgi:hypothetical protein
LRVVQIPRQARESIPILIAGMRLWFLTRLRTLRVEFGNGITTDLLSALAYLTSEH